MTTNNDLSQRMSFMRLDEPSGRALRSIKPIIERSLPGALETFYGQVRQYPEVKRFFSDDRAIESAGTRQQRHWGNISSADFNDDYVRSVRTIGHVHARIGLEPRWYIGGYALITEQLIRATLKERLPKGGLLTKPLKDADLADPIVALIKAVMLDMDFSISIYIEALDDERKAKEVELAEAEQQQSALVEALAKALADLSNGDLTTRLTQKFAPQYTKLQDDFNGAMEQLQNTMSVIGQASDGIRSGTNEISMASDDLSRRTENQAASLEQAAAALGEITSTVRRSSEGAIQAKRAVNSAKTGAEQSGVIVSQAVSAMSEIESSSRQITQIIGVIDEIAFQTNLLALNAGVEAARAGDAGRGFAVVASEVRALAQRSAEAAKEIKGLISESSRQVAAGVDLVGQTGQALKRIVEEVAEINDLVSQIAASAEEQSIGLQEVNTTVVQMDQVTQQNAAMVEQSTAASRQLADETTNLQALIGRFNYGEVATLATSRAPSRPAARPAPTFATRPPAAPAPKGGKSSRPHPLEDQDRWALNLTVRGLNLDGGPHGLRP